MPKSKGYALEVGEKGSSRLTLLNTLCNPFSLAFVSRLGNFKGKNVLELGCGIGLMALELAKIVGNEGKVTATDISVEQLAIAQNNASRANVKNIEFLECAAEKIEHINQRYGLIYCRFLLAHIKNYLNVIEQAIKLLDEGGILLCEEPSDIEIMFSQPESHVFSKWKDMCKDQIRIYGSNFSIGRELPGIFKTAGLVNLEVNTIQPIMFNSEIKAQLWLGLQEIKPILIEDGKPTEEIDALIKDLQAYTRLPEYIIGLYQYFQVAGRKLPQVTLHQLNEVEYEKEFYPIVVQTFASGLVENKQFIYKNAYEESLKYFESHPFLKNGHNTKDSFFYSGQHVSLGKIGLIWYYIKELSPEERIGRVGLIYTKEGKRQQGLAYTMMKEIEKKLILSGIFNLELNVFKFNQDAYKLYIKLGYEVDYTSTATNETRLLMKKTLCPQFEKTIFSSSNEQFSRNNLYNPAGQIIRNLGSSIEKSEFIVEKSKKELGEQWNSQPP